MTDICIPTYTTPRPQSESLRMDDAEINDLVEKDINTNVQSSLDTVYSWMNVLLSVFSSVISTEALLACLVLVIVMVFIRGEMQLRKLRSEILQRNEKDSKTPGEFYTKP